MMSFLVKLVKRIYNIIADADKEISNPIQIPMVFNGVYNAK